VTIVEVRNMDLGTASHRVQIWTDLLLLLLLFLVLLDLLIQELLLILIFLQLEFQGALHLARRLHFGLAVVRPGVVVAACTSVGVVKLNIAGAVVRCIPQVQVAVGLVVAIWLAVWLAPEPPRRAVGSAPCALLGVLRVHCTFFTAPAASLAPIVRSGHIDDEMRCIQWTSRLDES